MSLFIFPVHVFNPKTVNARPVTQAISGGKSLSGIEDVIETDGGGRWIIEYGDIDLRTAEQNRVWDAWQGYLAGGSVECLVPILSLYTAPRPAAWDKPLRSGGITYNDPTFPTSLKYSLPRIRAEVSANGLLRATRLGIDLQSAGDIQGGEICSIGNYAYRVTRETAPGVYQISPPLREWVAKGSTVDFNLPLVKCRVQPGQDFSAPRSFAKFGKASIVFVESVPVTESA